MKTILKKITSRHFIVLECLHWLLIVSISLLLGRWSISWSYTSDPYRGLDVLMNDHDLCYLFLDTLLYCLLGIVLKLTLDHKHRFTAVATLPFMIVAPLAFGVGCSYGMSIRAVISHFILILPLLLSGIGFITVLQQWYQAQLSRTYRGLFCLGFLAPLLPSIVLLGNCTSNGCLLVSSPSIAGLTDPTEVADFMDCTFLHPFVLFPTLLWLGWMVCIGFKATWNRMKTG